MAQLRETPAKSNKTVSDVMGSMSRHKDPTP